MNIQNNNESDEPGAASDVPNASDSALYQAMTATGFIGCIDTNEQLATTYKSRLDFSAKCGTSQ